MKGLFPCGASTEDSHNPAQRRATQATGRQSVCPASTCRAFLQFHTPLREGGSPVPAVWMECQQKEYKIRSPGTRRPKAKTLNWQVLSSDFSHLPLELPAVPLGKAGGHLGLRQLLGLEFRKRQAVASTAGQLFPSGSGQACSSLFQQAVYSTAPGPQPLDECGLVLPRAVPVQVWGAQMSGMASLSSAPGCPQ